MSYSNRLKIILISLTVLIFQNSLYSQDFIPYKLYFNNWKIVNPAAAGFDGSQKFDINYTHRTYSSDVLLSWEAQLKDQNSGIGLIFENQQIAASTRVYATALYNYQLNFDEDKKLSLGANLNFVSETFDNGSYIYIDQNDAIKNINTAASAFDFGIGMALKAKAFQGGLSIKNLLQSRINRDSLVRERNTVQHLTAYGEYRIGSRNFAFIPSTFLYTNYHYTYFDINPTFKFMNFLLLGGGLRIDNHNSNMNFRAGIDWKDKIQLSGIVYSTEYKGTENNIEFRLTIKIN